MENLVAIGDSDNDLPCCARPDCIAMATGRRSSDSGCRDRQQHGKRRRAGDRSAIFWRKSFRKKQLRSVSCSSTSCRSRRAARSTRCSSSSVAAAPCQCATAVARLGGEAKMISQVGEDAFATSHLVLRASNVDIFLGFRTNRANTALARLARRGGQPVSSPSTRNPADLFLDEKQITPGNVLKAARFLHSCSVDLVDYPARRTPTRHRACKAGRSLHLLRPERPPCSGAVRRTVRRRDGSSCPVRIWSS